MIWPKFCIDLNAKRFQKNKQRSNNICLIFKKPMTYLYTAWIQPKFMFHVSVSNTSTLYFYRVWPFHLRYIQKSNQTDQPRVNTKYSKNLFWEFLMVDLLHLEKFQRHFFCKASINFWNPTYRTRDLSQSHLLGICSILISKCNIDRLVIIHDHTNMEYYQNMNHDFWLYLNSM